jgi:hypothetical protein
MTTDTTTAASPTAPTWATVSAALKLTGNPTTLDGLRVAAGLDVKPSSRKAAAALDAVALWLATAGQEEQEEQTADDPAAVTLDALPPVGAGVSLDPNLGYLGRKSHTVAAAALSAAGVTDGKLISDKTGRPIGAARAVFGAVLDNALQATPVTRGETSNPGAVRLSLNGGTVGYVLPDTAAHVVIPASVLRAAASIGYDSRPHGEKMDKTGKRSVRFALKSKPYAVRQPGTDKTPPHAVRLDGYALADVLEAMGAVSVNRDYKSRVWAGVDVGEIIAAKSLTAAVRAVCGAIDSAATVKAARANPETAAAIEAVLVELAQDAAYADANTDATQTRKGAARFASKVAKVHDAADTINNGRKGDGTATTILRPAANTEAAA